MSAGLILDIDGTLIDSNDARAQAWVEALQEAGHEDVDFREARALVGRTAHDFLVRTLGFGEDTEPGVDISRRQRTIFERRYLERLVPLLRAPELLYRLRTIGARIVIVSNDRQEALGALLEKLHARPLLKNAVTPDVVPGIRSNRDLIKAALERLGGGRALQLADGPHDIEAAKRCGVPTIALLSGGFSQDALSGAMKTYDDAEHLFAEFYTSAFAAPAPAG